MIEHNGWLNIYKPTNISSFGVIKKIKKKFNLKKIGHAGTLDPLAEGVLPIAIGKTTKLIQFINKEVKEYEFEIKWGEQTSTDDREGEVIDRSDYVPSELEIKRALDFFLGEIIQLPPKASAVKINGERAYSLFRKNKEFKTKEKVVTIYQSSIIKSEKNNISKMLVNLMKKMRFYWTIC
jgi:tRNA pseudouridine55 synthase